MLTCPPTAAPLPPPQLSAPGSDQHRFPASGEAAAGIGAASDTDLTINAKTGRNPQRPYTPLVDQLQDGQYAIIARRQGGPWDPCGARPRDVRTAENICFLGDLLPGRWCMVTLTINRRGFISPEVAYDICNERVKEVARKISYAGIHISVVEFQEKTGEGWPHWHMMVYCPDDRTPAEIKAQVESRWRTRHHAVDQETGEVTGYRYERIGWVDVQAARDRKGAARYIAKYIVKPTKAVPPWLGESTRQIRKYRLSHGSFKLLAFHGRHVVKRGSRPSRHTDGNPRPRRTIYHRRAMSQSSHALFQRRDGALHYQGDLPIPADPAGLQILYGVTPDIFMDSKRINFRLDAMSLDHLRKAVADDAARSQHRYIRQRLRQERNSWHALQHFLANEREHDPPPTEGPDHDATQMHRSDYL